jgi:5-methylcytosine-specific restriction endonuclease McrA
MNETLHYEYGDKTILELIGLQECGSLNLEPGFQRKSVWRPPDRRKLVASILEGYPIPSIFLHQRAEDGRPVYDVIDGKQRLETIFMFSRTSGFGRGGFEVPFQFAAIGDEEQYLYTWADLKKHKLTEPFLSYKIQTVEIKGGLSEIVDLFVRINSTGKSLTPSERRHARFYKSPLLREAERLARRYRSYFQRHRVMSSAQIDRMKDVELVSELLSSILAGGPIQGKAAVDKAVGNQQINGNTLRKTIDELKATVSTVTRMFPELRSTRFHNLSEFYTLFLVIWEMRKQNLVLRDKKRNRVAQQLLIGFSNGVDRVQLLLRQAKAPKGEDRPYTDYLLSVQRGTDQLANRRRRAELVRNLFGGLFAGKDDQRIFSPEQRRLLWNSEEKKACKGCGEALDWTNFEMDHVKAHALGGKTALGNAALLCKRCNVRKGAGRGAKAGRERAENGRRRLTPEMMLKAVWKLRKPTKKELEQLLGFSGLTIHNMLEKLIAKRQIIALDTWPKQYQRRTGGKK